MASNQKSIPSSAGILAASILMITSLTTSMPSWAGRDAGQMIAQDKANRDVIARRQAAINAAAGASAAASVPPAVTTNTN